MRKPKSAAIVESSRLTITPAHSRHSWHSYTRSRRSSERRSWTILSRHKPTMGAVLAPATEGGSSNNVEPQVLARHLTGHVLLVDDVHEDALLLAALLTPLETNVIVARSASEALAMLDEQVADLVVTDLNMPGPSGLDLTRVLRKRHDVPAVIFLTGSLSARDKVEAMELGAAAYLQKPVDVGHLIRVAREILGPRCTNGTDDAAVENANPPRAR
jgi:CheY-like chemotaxis protein